MSTFSIFLLLSLFVATAFSDYFLLFSHQAPRVPEVKVSLSINAHVDEEFKEIEYGESTEYTNITDYQIDGQPGVFNLTVWTVEEPHVIILNGTYVFGTTSHWSYYVINQINDTAVDDLVVASDFAAPEQLTGLWRVTNLAPVELDFDLYINGQKQASFEYASITPYAAVDAGVYNFEVFLNGTSVAAKNASIDSGEVTTVIFNGVKLGDDDQDWDLDTEVDQEFEGSYNTCYVRVVNSVANANYSTLHTFFAPDPFNPFGTVGYSEVTEYVAIDAGHYIVYFVQDDEYSIDDLSVSLNCEVSEHYTLSYQGNPSSLNPDLRVIARVLEDESELPYYAEALLRVDLLSTSYSSDVAVFVNGQNVETISYGDEEPEYLSITNETVVLRLVDSASQSQILNETFNVEFGHTYSYFLLGLSNSAEYPVSGILQADSTNVEPTTTTTTTTGGTTGTSGTTGHHDDDDDDDDDDDLTGGEIAGIVIGVLAGVAIVGGLCFFLVRRQRRAQFSTIG